MKRNINQQIIRRLNIVSGLMYSLGKCMDKHGGLTELGKHGRELRDAGYIARGWAEAMAKKKFSTPSHR